jgi:hypothetical protein
VTQAARLELPAGVRVVVVHEGSQEAVQTSAAASGTAMPSAAADAS